ncbi:MAG: hypothetical protein M3291_09595 [Actinomycetota bacterium]|nr:hypothetical protein [Actinomycetota bacterium]
MPSSVVFAGLAVAWLAVLVPMVAKRRQEVLRTADSALASRVLRRPAPAPDRADHGEEMTVMTDQTTAPGSGPEDDLRDRPFRPGRGGYDPEAAALAARAKYSFRQRVVIGLLAVAVASVVLALTMSATWWWALAASVTSLAGYLAYLRRQVRIEEEVRYRRVTRLGSVHSHLNRSLEPDDDAAAYDGHAAQGEYAGHDEYSRHDEPASDLEETPVPRVVPRSDPVPRPDAHPRAVALDLDDEDPAFEELSPVYEPPHRRAVGE